MVRGGYGEGVGRVWGHPRYKARIDRPYANVPQAMQAADYMNSDAKHRKGEAVVDEKEGNRSHGRQLRLAGPVCVVVLEQLALRARPRQLSRAHDEARSARAILPVLHAERPTLLYALLMHALKHCSTGSSVHFAHADPPMHWQSGSDLLAFWQRAGEP